MTLITNQSPEVINYGQGKYEQGYADGYQKSTTDRRVRLMAKKKNLSKHFKTFVHYLEVLKD